MLIGKPLARAPHAGLNLVHQQKRAGGIAQFPRGREEFLADRTDAALALDRFNADTAYLVRELRTQIGDTINTNTADARHHRLKRLAVLLLVCGRDRANRPAVEAMFHRKKIRPDALPLRT